MEAPETKLKTKLVQLQMTVSRTEKVLKTESLQAIERQQTSLKTITTEIDLLKSEVEAKKITDEENPDEIETWIGKIDKELSKADVEVQRLQQWQDTVLRDEKQRQREEQLQHERELYETKIKMKSALKLSSESGGGKDEIQAKLPKLTITKFNGTFTDWTRFWNQFSETIDKTDIPNVTKFAYLRELLETNVRKTVEALPFTSEGYTRAIFLGGEIWKKMRDYQGVYEADSRTSGYTECKHQGNSRVLRHFDVCRAVVGDYGRIATSKWKRGLNIREATRNSWRSYKNRSGLGKLGLYQIG